MNCVTLTAGVDVGKTFLDLGFHPAGKPVRYKNDERGIAQLIAAVQKRGTLSVAIEAIGPYAQRLVAALATAGVAPSPSWIRAASARSAPGGHQSRHGQRRPPGHRPQ